MVSINLANAKVSHLARLLPISNILIVGGEVPVKDIMRVEIGQSLQGPCHEWCSPEYGRRRVS